MTLLDRPRNDTPERIWARTLQVLSETHGTTAELLEQRARLASIKGGGTSRTIRITHDCKLLDECLNSERVDALAAAFLFVLDVAHVRLEIVTA